MANRVLVEAPRISGNRIDYAYRVEGEWADAFQPEEAFFIEYGCDISSVPEGVAVVPLLANLLPMAWVHDAEIAVPVCDRDFFGSIEDFKRGYAEMYPMLEFKGKLTAGALEECRPESGGGALAFFSGGVDAFNTLICHREEKPTLLTLWGADVKFRDAAGWERVRANSERVAAEFGVDFVPVKSCLRRFLNYEALTRKVAASGDNWWHGFQHGIGLISHAAPVAYAAGKTTVYFASTNTAADRGKIPCASDPAIDNFVRFCGARAVHDGYQSTRSMKLRSIAQYCRSTGGKVRLRVCWESRGGANCCGCEKCWRTMLALYAEGLDPRDYGFEYDDRRLKKLSGRMRYEIDKFQGSYYRPIQETMRANFSRDQLPAAIRWFYSADITKLGRDTPYKKFRRGARRAVRKLLRRR